MPKVRAKRSAIWLHFSEYNVDENNTTVKCNRCNVEVPYCKNTTNLWSHIRTHHTNILENASILKHHPQDSSGEWSSSTNSSMIVSNSSERGQSVEQIASKTRDKVQTYPWDSKRSREITFSLIQMIAEDGYTFSIVDSTGFANFVRTLDDRYKLPDRNTLTSRYLPELYMSKCKEIEDRLSRATNVHLTIDSWTDTNRDATILATTAHFCIDGTLQRNTLQIAYFLPRATATNLQEMIVQSADTWKITSKIKTIVSDNANNIVDTMSTTLSWRQIPCFRHLLNLVVDNAIKESPIAANVIRKCRDIVDLFKTNNVAVNSLRSQQIRQRFTKILSLKRDVTGRWNYVYTMLSRITELRSVLSVILADSSHKGLCITRDEWEIVSGMTTILRPLHEATKEVIGDSCVTISKIIPIVHCIEVTLKNQGNLPFEVQSMRGKLLTELSKCFENMEAHPVYAVATFLDPRYKNIAFRSRECVELAQNQLMNAYSHFENENKEFQSSKVSRMANEHVETNDTLWAEFDKKVQETGAGTSYCFSSLKDQLDRYLSSKVINRKLDPIAWWNTEGNTMYPKLTKLALEYLCVPASSIPRERLILKVGLILSDRRTRLQPKHVNMLAVLSLNKNK
ncbi:E3 SUMO-protein ligase ZBED1 [Ptiloglossa arizonensis]|uniref:E3 SUMO-protein ligase ZBED1 n=1 Tax=Ptiloglossa arizonensis TaxID=3350558 RepID=UPI003F9FD013